MYICIVCKHFVCICICIFCVYINVCLFVCACVCVLCAYVIYVYIYMRVYLYYASVFVYVYLLDELPEARVMEQCCDTGMCLPPQITAEVVAVSCQGEIVEDLGS